MVAKSTKALKVRLKEVMKERSIKFPELSQVTGIPAARMYKWYQEDTSPKAEDAELLEKWISDPNKLEISPPPNEQKNLVENTGAGASSTHQALLNLTESTKRLSESNLINARNIERLITLMETNSRGSRGRALAEDPGFAGLVHLMAKIAVGKRWGSEDEFLALAMKEVEIPSLEAAERGR